MPDESQQKLGDIRTLSKDALLFKPDAVYNVGLNEDYTPGCRERVRRFLCSLLCVVSGHRWEHTNSYRKAQPPKFVPESITPAILELLSNPIYYVRPVLWCKRCERTRELLRRGN